MSYTHSEWSKLTPDQQKKLIATGQAPNFLKVPVIIIGVVLLLIFILMMKSCLTPEPEKKLTAQEKHKQKVEALFSGWNGSHKKLEKMIKQNLNDPSSYEHVQTLYWDEQDSVIVKTTIRAKNGFGAIMTTSYRAVSDLQGNLRSISQE